MFDVLHGAENAYYTYTAKPIMIFGFVDIADLRLLAC